MSVKSAEYFTEAHRWIEMWNFSLRYTVDL